MGLAAAIYALLATQGLSEAPPLQSVAITSGEYDPGLSKELFGAKDAAKIASSKGFHFMTKDGVGFFIQSNLMIAEKVRSTTSLLKAVIASSGKGDRGIVDLSKLPARDRDRVRSALGEYKGYLNPRQRPAVDRDDFKFALEPEIYARVSAGTKAFSVIGSLGDQAEVGGILNEDARDPDTTAPDSQWQRGANLSGGKVTWQFSPAFRRQSERLRAMHLGGDLMWAATESDLKALDDAWRAATEELCRQYAGQIGQLSKDADSFSKLDALMQQHLMLSFSRDFAANGFSSRLEAETWLRGANLKDTHAMLFIAVGSKDANGQIRRTEFPLIRP